MFVKQRFNSIREAKAAIEAFRVLGATTFTLRAYGTWEDRQGDLVFATNLQLEALHTKYATGIIDGEVDKIAPLEEATIEVRTAVCGLMQD